MEEHQIADETVLAEIPKLEAEWKVIHELKPMDLIDPDDPRLALSVNIGEEGDTSLSCWGMEVLPLPRTS